MFAFGREYHVASSCCVVRCILSRAGAGLTLLPWSTGSVSIFFAPGGVSLPLISKPDRPLCASCMFAGGWAPPVLGSMRRRIRSNCVCSDGMLPCTPASRGAGVAACGSVLQHGAFCAQRGHVKDQSRGGAVVVDLDRGERATAALAHYDPRPFIVTYLHRSPSVRHNITHGIAPLHGAVSRKPSVGTAALGTAGLAGCTPRRLGKSAQHRSRRPRPLRHSAQSAARLPLSRAPT